MTQRYPWHLGCLMRVPSLGRVRFLYPAMAGVMLRVWCIVGLGVGVSILGGCMLKRVDLAQTGAVSLRTEAPEHIHLSAAVYAESDTLIVSGSVHMHSRIMRPFAGHIDVEVMRSDGERLYTQRMPYWVKFSPKQRYPHATFTATFPTPLLQGFVITVRHHADAHQESQEPRDPDAVCHYSLS